MESLKTKILAFSLMFVCTSGAWSQSCSVPQPLTPDQVVRVVGEWYGSYQLNGVDKDFAVTIKVAETGVSASISNAPISGNVEKESYRFCPSAAFHMNMELAGGYYEFDGVPEDGKMEGTLTVKTSDKVAAGKFNLRKGVATRP